MKFLYEPTKPYIVTQFFGENKVCYKRTISGIEYSYKRTEDRCPMGFESMYSQMRGHNGADSIAKSGTPVYAMQKGTVIEVSTETERGLGVGILSQIKGAVVTEYYKHRYWHFKGLNVKIGDKVKTGQLIGWADNTGYSTGDHLHIELKLTDKEGRTVHTDNGYFGGIDPLPHMYPKFALNISYINTSLEAIAKVLDVISEKVRQLLVNK